MSEMDQEAEVKFRISITSSNGGGLGFFTSRRANSSFCMSGIVGLGFSCQENYDFRLAISLADSSSLSPLGGESRAFCLFSLTDEIRI